MRCSTCGEHFDDGSPRCPTCGTANFQAQVHPEPVNRCPRCGHRGDGISYFRRPGHIALLVFFSVFTYGVGGLIYWLVKRQHSICPNCGLDWQMMPLNPVERKRALAASSVSPTTSSAGTTHPIGRLPRSGLFRRILGVVAILASVLLVFVGVFELEVGAIVSGSMLAAGGALSYWWGWRAQQGRRQAVLGGLQRQVLMLASRKGGTLTVTEVATDLDLSMPMAEKVMMSMDDGFRIRSEVTGEGLLLYEFPELQRRPGADSSPRIEPETGLPG